MKPLSDQALARLRSAAALPDLTGTRYGMVREAGRGGMGAVYIVHDAELGRDVALKVFHLGDERLRIEARALARLEHPNIVPIYDFGRLEDGRLYYTMKLVDGHRLDEYRRGPATQADRLRVFTTICGAVAFAHSRGVVHRDLKPENIMVGPFGEVLVMDWGLAKSVGEAAPQGQVAGTAEYMAPEQARGETAIDERADIHALGRILGFLCEDPPPKPLRSIASKAAAADRAQRYPTASALATDVLHYLDGLAVSAHPESALESAARWCHNNRTLLLLIGAYAAARFLIFFWARR
jgi:serine/threonine protein kinase